MDRVRCADRQKALLVESTQDFGLGLETHVADLVEEEGSTVGAFEGSAFFCRAALDGSVTVAEEFAFDVVLGNCGAVEFDERPILAQAFGVHGAADELLTRASLAGNQDRRVAARHLRDT